MPRLSADSWDSIRAERETGTSFGDLAKKYGVSKQAIIKRAHKEQWANGEDVAEIVRRKVAEKVAGIVTTGNPEKKAKAINDAADETVGLIRRHRQEWVQVAKLRQEAVDKRKEDQDSAFAAAKFAKITAEMTAIQQAGERKAWSLDVDKPQGPVVIRWEGSE